MGQSQRHPNSDWRTHLSLVNNRVINRLKTAGFIRAQHLIPQQQFSRLVGKLAASENPLIKQSFIRGFAKQYQIDMSLAQHEDLNSYPSFNAFFTRPIKASVRPIDPEPNHIVSPADGAVSQIGQIHGDAVFQAKGQPFSAVELIGDRVLTQPFLDGQFATIYLSPRDYHRVHMPFAGRLTETIYIPGELFSVNGTTAAHVDGLFARNERMVCLFDIQVNGNTERMAVVLVGAMIVAGIESVATGKISRTEDIQETTHSMALAKGDELGRFYLGSTAIVIMPKAAKADWQNEMSANTVVQIGQLLGKAKI